MHKDHRPRLPTRFDPWWLCTVDTNRRCPHSQGHCSLLSGTVPSDHLGLFSSQVVGEASGRAADTRRAPHSELVRTGDLMTSRNCTASCWPCSGVRIATEVLVLAGPAGLGDGGTQAAGVTEVAADARHLLNLPKGYHTALPGARLAWSAGGRHRVGAPGGPRGRALPGRGDDAPARRGLDQLRPAGVRKVSRRPSRPSTHRHHASRGPGRTASRSTRTHTGAAFTPKCLLSAGRQVSRTVAAPSRRPPGGLPHGPSWAELMRTGGGCVEGRPRAPTRSGCARSTGRRSVGRRRRSLTATVTATRVAGRDRG